MIRLTAYMRCLRHRARAVGEALTLTIINNKFIIIYNYYESIIYDVKLKHSNIIFVTIISNS